MSRKIVFLADFFAEHVSGGAEIYDNVLITELEKRGIKVCKFRCAEFTLKHLNLYMKMNFKFIISNFISLPESVKKVLQVYGDKYVIIEHDHKYLKERNPALYKDFKAPSMRLSIGIFIKVQQWFLPIGKNTGRYSRIT